MTTSLDARALAQPGGAFDSIVNALSRVVDRYAQVSDRNADHDLDLARLEAGKRERDQMQRRALEMAGVNAGVKPGTMTDQALLDAIGGAQAQTRTLRTQAEQAALDHQLLSNDGQVVEQVRAGNRAPRLPAPIEVQAAEEGQRDRSAVAALRDAQAKHLLTTNASGSKMDAPTAAKLKAAHELADAEAQRRGVVEFDVDGKRKIKDPGAWNTILRESYALHGVNVPESWSGWKPAPAPGSAVPGEDGKVAFPTPDGPNPGFFSLHPSGVDGESTIVDLPRKIAKAVAIDAPAAALDAAIGAPARAVGRMLYAQDPAYTSPLTPEIEATVTKTLQSSSLSPEQSQRLARALAAAKGGGDREPDRQAAAEIAKAFQRSAPGSDRAVGSGMGSDIAAGVINMAKDLPGGLARMMNDLGNGPMYRKQ